MPEYKRKVNGADRVAADELDDRGSKRRKLPGDNLGSSKGESPESTRIEGLKALEHIRTITDKSGRKIHTAFLSLPNKRTLPEYYKVIKLPISIETLENKLKRNEFATLTDFESHFKRMVTNAKEFNEKGSQIYEDAERLRKGFSNYITKVNPAYKVHGFQVHAVAVPGDESDEDEDADSDQEDDEESDVEEAIPAKKGRGRGSKNTASRKSVTPSLSESKYAGKSFAGLNFQQAQEKIVEDVIQHKEEPSDPYKTFEVFIELPPKSLKDYYAVITQPRSLNTLWQQVRGVDIDKKGSEASGVSKFGSWEEFEAEASIIWTNACHYNEDGSEIFELAKELEVFFLERLEKAKKIVAGPKKIMLKLGGNKAPQPAPSQNPKITLKMPGQKASPAPQADDSNGASGTPPAANGTSRRNPFGGSVSGATPLPLDQLERARSMSGSVASPTNSAGGPVKNEEGSANSPALAPNATYRASSQAVSTPGLNGAGMPPPLTPSQSFGQAGYTQPFHQQYQVQNSLESKFRPEGKNASDAMITNLSLSSHPGLNITKHFKMDLPASPTLTQQSITINLPSTHYYLQIKPTIAESLLQRQHKLFITLNTQRLHAMPLLPGHSLDPRHPLFEGRLTPGVNRLEVEIIAALPKDAAKLPGGQDTELEKITVFANLLRAV